MREHDSEPVPGLPGHLPEGETLLWQGKPSAAGIARRVFHIRGAAFYFAALIVLRFGFALWNGEAVAEAASAATWFIFLGGAALALLWLMAWLMARTTIYSITSRRVVMRYGVSVPMALNLPFSIIQSADLNAGTDGAGDISLTLGGDGRMAYLHLWPHARPWHISEPKPSLRALPDATTAANVLSTALAVAHPQGQRTRVSDQVHDGLSSAVPQSAALGAA